uniref:Solute carrier family 22 member 13-like n=1 Tax=Scleropages formosus TaxID=113540 RepID=A0A8D0CN53_SCLFO
MPPTPPTAALHMIIWTHRRWRAAACPCFSRMAPLQRSVCWRLSLSFVFTAFMFFVDVFTANLARCGALEGLREPNVTDSTCMEAGEPFTYGQTMFMIGLLIGSLFGGALADKYGKRVVHLGSNILQAVTALMTAFLPSAAFYLAARWIAGLTCCGINITSFSLGVEWSLPKYRTWPPALLSFSFSVGMMFLAAVAFLTSGWMQFHLAMAVPQLLCLPFYYSIPESPQWLLLNRRLEVLEEYRNRCPEDKESLDLILNSMGKEAQGSSRAEGKSEKHSFLLLFRSPTILLRLSVMSYIGQKCVAFVNLWYRIGCILNAVLVPSGRIPLGAMICYSSGPILGAGLCRLLPETSGTPLPDTILDCEMQPGPRLKCTTCNWKQSQESTQDKGISSGRGHSVIQEECAAFSLEIP